MTALEDPQQGGQASKFDYCFILAHGRSGSTLLQGILNTIPGYVIRGENGGVLVHAERLVNVATAMRERYSAIGRTPQEPWYGIGDISRQSLLVDLRETFVRNFIRPRPGDRCVGFKEIRYGSASVPDLAAFLDFMDELFPRACFIFNVRNPRDAARSGFWASRDGAFEYLTEFHARMRDAYNRNRPNYFWIDYDEYRAAPQALAPLFDFLGEAYDLARLGKVFELTHSTRAAGAQ